MSGALGVTVFVISLLAAIMLHELGHLVTAKRFGMRADRFFVGFGPTLWSTRRGETEYGVKALPLGGFVRIVGMSPIDQRQPPVVDEVLAGDALLEDRRAAAVRLRTDPLGVGNLPEESWERLRRTLVLRGAPPALAERIVGRTRASLPAAATVAEARATLAKVLVTEVPDSGRVGDLHHRLVQGDRDRFFHDRPAWQRAIVLVSGSVMHFVIAVACLAGAYLFVPQLTGTLLPVVDLVLEDSPAEEAGLRAGDRVVGVGELRTTDFEVLREEIAARPGVRTELVVVRDGTELVLDVTPAPETDPVTGELVGRVGFLPTAELARMRPFAAAEHALVGEPSMLTPGGFVPMFTGSIEALVRVFSPDGIAGILRQATGQAERAVDGAISLVGVASIAGQTGGDALGLTLFLALLASINVFIGIFNLLPLPPLDGGHLAVLAIERSVNTWRSLRGRQADFTVDPRAIAAIAIPVIALLGTLFLVLLWLDITDPIRLG